MHSLLLGICRHIRYHFLFLLGLVLASCGGSEGNAPATSVLAAASTIATGNPNTNIAAWGDSLTAGAGGTPYPTQLQVLLPGRTIFNGGVGGQTSTSIIARQGGIPISISIQGGTIPPSGSVGVSNISVPVVDWQGPSALYGTIAKVYGYIQRLPDANTANNSLVFIRATSGNSVLVPDNSSFAVDTFGREAWINVFWIGTNNAGYEPDRVLSDAQAAVSFLRKPAKRFVVMSVLNNSASTIGTDVYLKITNLNEQLKATYPENFIDIRRYLISQYDPSSAQDLADVANDVVPSSLRSDTIHLNTKGYGLVAQQVAAFIGSHGW